MSHAGRPEVWHAVWPALSQMEWRAWHPGLPLDLRHTRVASACVCPFVLSPQPVRLFESNPRLAMSPGSPRTFWRGNWPLGGWWRVTCPVRRGPGRWSGGGDGLPVARGGGLPGARAEPGRDRCDHRGRAGRLAPGDVARALGPWEALARREGMYRPGSDPVASRRAAGQGGRPCYRQPGCDAARPVVVAAYLRLGRPSTAETPARTWPGRPAIPRRRTWSWSAGPDPEFSYQALNQAFGHLQRGARLVAMHRGLYWHTSEGPQLDAGAFVPGLEQAAATEAEVVGKPASGEG